MSRRRLNMKKILPLAAAALMFPAFSGEDFTAPPMMTLHPDSRLETYSGFNGFSQLTTETVKPLPLVPADAHVRLATDGKTLRINASSEFGPRGIFARVNPPAGGAMVFRDDSYELVILPNPKDKSESYHIYINGKGAVHSNAMENGKYKDWKPAKTVKNDFTGDSWQMVLDLPLAQFGLDKLKPGQAFGLRICRNWRNLNLKFYDGGMQSTWNQMRATFLGVEKLPLVVIQPDSPAVDFFSIVTKKERKPDCRFRITNPSRKKQTWLAEYRHELELSQPAGGNLELTLNPGESRIVPMPIPQVLNNERVMTRLTVKSADGKTVFYNRSAAWKQGKEKDFFAGTDKNLVYVMPQMAYYPSTNKMRIQVNCKAEKNLEKLKKLRAEITMENGKKIAEFDLPKPDANRISDTVVQLPDLKEITRTKNPSGKYKMSLISEGLGYKPIVIPFATGCPKAFT